MAWHVPAPRRGLVVRANPRSEDDGVAGHPIALERKLSKTFGRAQPGSDAATTSAFGRSGAHGIVTVSITDQNLRSILLPLRRMSPKNLMSKSN